MHKLWRTAFSSLISVGALVGSVALGALPASAQVQQAPQVIRLAMPELGPIHCSGDVCARWVTRTGKTPGGVTTIATWARNKTFSGHFELIVPKPGGHWNTGDRTWLAGGKGYVYHFKVELRPGNYVAIAWEEPTEGVYKDIGRVSFSV